MFIPSFQAVLLGLSALSLVLPVNSAAIDPATLFEKRKGRCLSSSATAPAGASYEGTWIIIASPDTSTSSKSLHVVYGGSLGSEAQLSSDGSKISVILTASGFTVAEGKAYFLLPDGNQRSGGQQPRPVLMYPDFQCTLEYDNFSGSNRIEYKIYKFPL